MSTHNICFHKENQKKKQKTQKHRISIIWWVLRRSFFYFKCTPWIGRYISYHKFSKYFWKKPKRSSIKSNTVITINIHIPINILGKYFSIRLMRGCTLEWHTDDQREITFMQWVRKNDAAANIQMKSWFKTCLSLKIWLIMLILAHPCFSYIHRRLYGPVNTVEVMSSWSINLLTFPGQT